MKRKGKDFKLSVWAERHLGVILGIAVLTALLPYMLHSGIKNAEGAACPGTVEFTYNVGCYTCCERGAQGVKGEIGSGTTTKTYTDAGGNVWEATYRCYNCGVTKKNTDLIYAECITDPALSHSGSYHRGPGEVPHYVCDFCGASRNGNMNVNHKPYNPTPTPAPTTVPPTATPKPAVSVTPIPTDAPIPSNAPIPTVTMAPSAIPTPTQGPTPTPHEEQPQPTSAPVQPGQSKYYTSHYNYYFTTDAGFSIDAVERSTTYAIASFTGGSGERLNSIVTHTSTAADSNIFTSTISHFVYNHMESVNYKIGDDAAGNKWYFEISGTNAVYVHPYQYNGYFVSSGVRNITELVFPSKIIYSGTEYTVVSIGGSGANYRKGLHQYDHANMRDYMQTSYDNYTYNYGAEQIGWEYEKNIGSGLIGTAPVYNGVRAKAFHGILGNGRVESYGWQDTSYTTTGASKSYNSEVNYYVYNTTLKKIVIPDTVTTICQYAFAYCQALSDIVGGSSITKIEDAAFLAVTEGISKLSYVSTYGDSWVTNYDNFFCYYNGTVNNQNYSTMYITDVMRNWERVIKLPHYLKVDFAGMMKLNILGPSCFYGRKNLYHVELPPSITKIDSSAFAKSALDTIKIPSTQVAISGAQRYDKDGRLTEGFKTLGQYQDSGKKTTLYTVAGSPAIMYGLLWSEYYDVVVSDGYGITYEPNGGTGEKFTQVSSVNSNLVKELEQKVNSLIARQTQIKEDYQKGTITYQQYQEQLKAVNTELEKVANSTGDYTASYTATIYGCPFEREGYIFNGWNTKADGTGTVYLPGQVLNMTSSVTLYAQWKVRSVTLTYDFNFDYSADGTSEAVNPSTGITGTSKAVLPGGVYGELPNPSRDGYIFAGWYFGETNGNGSGTAITAATTVTQNKDHTVYARWEAIPYKVQYIPNGGSGSMPVTSFIYDIAGNLYKNSYTFPDVTVSYWYDVEVGQTQAVIETLTAAHTTSSGTFLGWSKAEDGAVAFSDQAVVKSLTTVYGAVLPIYAKWNCTEVTIPNITRTGYIFDGWNTKEDGTGTAYMPGNQFKPEKNTVLYAVWNAEEYTVTFDFNFDYSMTTGTPAVNAKTNWTGTGKQVFFEQEYGKLPQPVRDGYTFAGWYTAEAGGNGTGNMIAEDTWVESRANHVLYARWIPGEYTLTFYPNDGSNVTETVKVIYDTVGYYDVSDKVPERRGYTFGGWYTATEGGTQVYSVNGTGVNGSGYWENNLWKHTGNVNVYGRWTPGTYQMTLDANGGTVGTKDITVIYDSTTNADLSWNLPVRDEYVFEGWYSALEDGVQIYDKYGHCVNDGEYWKNGKWYYTQNCTLYAKWRAEYMTGADIRLIPKDEMAIKQAVLKETPETPLLDWYEYGDTKLQISMNTQGYFHHALVNIPWEKAPREVVWADGSYDENTGAWAMNSNLILFEESTPQNYEAEMDRVRKSPGYKNEVLHLTIDFYKENVTVPFFSYKVDIILIPWDIWRLDIKIGKEDVW